MNGRRLSASLHGKRLGSTVRGLRHRLLGGRAGVPSAERRADPDVLAVVTEPFESVADAHDGLAELEALLRERGDRRAVFLTVYLAVTEAVSGRIDRSAYEDPAWVGRYLATFADHYRRALLAFEREDDGPPPPPWRIAFEAALGGETLVLQDAFLGVNAHVTYDLAYALDEVGIDENRDSRYRDHTAVNDALRSVTDEIESVLDAEYDTAIGEVDAALGRVDEAFSYVSLKEARELAWHHAVGLSDSPLGLRRAVTRWLIRTSSTAAADAALAPSVPPRVVAELRTLEGETPMGRTPTDGVAGGDGTA